MPRAITGTVHKKRASAILKRTKGFRGSRSKLYRVAKNAMFRALDFAYTGRKRKKRDYRRLWIARINAACRNEDITYSQFTHGLKLAGVELNRKILANLAIEDSNTFSKLVEKAKSKLK